MINDARCTTSEIQSRTAMAKAAFNKQPLFASKLDFKEETNKVLDLEL